MLHPWLEEEFNDNEVNNLNAKYYERKASEIQKPRNLGLHKQFFNK